MSETTVYCDRYLKLMSNEEIYEKRCIKIHKEDRNKERCELPYANFYDPTMLRNRHVSFVK